MATPEKPILLIVEDDERLRYLAGAAAERCGHFARVQGAPDGRAALDLIRHALRTAPEAVPDIILSDLSMPHLDGLELIRELKQEPETRGIPIAIMTSSNRPNDREDAAAAGACAFFEKPQRLDDLIALVASLPDMCGAAGKSNSPGSSR